MNDAELRERLYEWCSIALVHADRLDATWKDVREARAHTSMTLGWIEAGRPKTEAAQIRTLRKRITHGHRWQLRADIHAFLNAAAQVSKIVAKLDPSNYPSPPKGTSLHDARNYEEHWEAPSAATVAAVEATMGEKWTPPGTALEIESDLWVGGVPLGEVSDWIRRVRRAVGKQLKAAGVIAPDARTRIHPLRPTNSGQDHVEVHEVHREVEGGVGNDRPEK